MTGTILNPFRRAVLSRPGRRLVNLLKKGPVNLIDVGSVGELPSPWRENRGNIRQLLKFEPRDEPSKDPYVTTMDVALWEMNCERDFYICKGQSGVGSSLFQQNYEYVRENFEELRLRGSAAEANTWFERSGVDRIEKVTCRKLDNILHDLNQPFKYHFLKIDAQGAEHQILRGAEDFLQDSCLGLHLELFTVPLYKGITLLPEVAHYLEDRGFELIKKFPAHGTFHSQHDCFFLKSKSKGKIVDTIRRVYNS